MKYHIYAGFYGYAVYRHGGVYPAFIARFDDLKTAAGVADDLNRLGGK